MTTLAPRQPASRQLPGVAGLVLEWLEEVHPSKFHETIERRGDGPWKSCEKGGWTLDRIALAVASPDLTVGIRSEKETKIIVFDIDRKKGFKSCYWDEFGNTPTLNQLKSEIERAGCAWSLTRSSSSGGLHVQVTLPEAIQTWKAHWVGRMLALRSGIALEAGQAELFPSRVDYSRESRQRSQGVRLPGQEGSALILGQSLIEEPDLIYKQLLADLDETNVNDEWQNLLEAAGRLAKREKVESYKKASVKLFNLDVEWTGCGQSQENLMRITRWVIAKNPGITCPSTIGQKVHEAALSTPGFKQFASRETQADLARKNGGLGERMARSFLKRVFSGVKSLIQKLGGDPERNDRLYKESQRRLYDVWLKTHEAGENPRNLSQRKVTILTGLNRKTVIHHWDFWSMLLDHTPPITVCALRGDVKAQGDEGRKVSEGCDEGGVSAAEVVTAVEKQVQEADSSQEQHEPRHKNLSIHGSGPPDWDFCDNWITRLSPSPRDGMEDFGSCWPPDLTRRRPVS
jgi:hypothetical protein